MDSSELDYLARRLERMLSKLEALHLDAYLRYIKNWKRRLLSEFVNGIVRGLGFSVGFSILGALILYILRNVTLSNLPVIGQFLAELLKIVENNLQ